MNQNLVSDEHQEYVLKTAAATMYAGESASHVHPVTRSIFKHLFDSKVVRTPYVQDITNHREIFADYLSIH